jgi:leucyl aminopeptidase
MRLRAVNATSMSGNLPLLVLLVDKSKISSLPGGELGRRAAALARRKEVFEGESRKTLLLHAEARGGPRALLLIGMGKAAAVQADDFRRAGAIAVRQAMSLKISSVTVGVSGKLILDADSLAALGQGAVLAGYRYPRKKSDPKPPDTVSIVVGFKGASRVLKAAGALAEGANLARELGDLPGNIATPKHLADTARKLGRSDALRCKVYDKKALQRMKMGGILAVNQGSAKPPFLLELDYHPAGARKTLCVVGKGLTFDAGGISIKPAGGMEEMKYDMCGAATVLGLMQALAVLKPKGLRVIGIVGTTENMVGAAAYKPGDVITTASGTTIEVINTDAEGRVVLADALHHATKFKPDAIIDLATLTGAIVVALGHEAAGLFCRDDALADKIEAAAERTDERVWRMPTWSEYDDLIKGRFGDIKNSAGRWAGSCTAAQFLFHFTGDYPHAHIDVAGAAWGARKRDYYVDGATGFGVRLLYDLITNWKR